MSKGEHSLREGLSYKRSQGSAIFRQDGAKIPADPDNRDYQEYLRWVAAGGQTADADPAPVPSNAPSPLDRLAALEAKDAQREAKIAALEAEVSAVRGGRAPAGGNDTL